MRTVDLLFFMGQSNMAGRGDAAIAPVIAPGMGCLLYTSDAADD